MLICKGAQVDEVVCHCEHAVNKHMTWPRCLPTVCFHFRTHLTARHQTDIEIILENHRSFPFTCIQLVVIEVFFCGLLIPAVATVRLLLRLPHVFERLMVSRFKSWVQCRVLPHCSASFYCETFGFSRLCHTMFMSERTLMFCKHSPFVSWVHIRTVHLMFLSAD